MKKGIVDAYKNANKLYNFLSNINKNKLSHEDKQFAAHKYRKCQIYKILEYSIKRDFMSLNLSCNCNYNYELMFCNQKGERKHFKTYLSLGIFKEITHYIFDFYQENDYQLQ